MASRYLKIPVVQRVITSNEKGDPIGSYSKIMKTLRIPQEFLGTSTGSLYFSGVNAKETFDGKTHKLTTIVKDQLDAWADMYASGDVPPSSITGFWMQIPLNVSKTLWQSTTVSPVGGDDADNFLEYNGALWLRVSQEVVFTDPFNQTKTWYTYPYLSNLYKQNNSSYEEKNEEQTVLVGNKGYNQVQKILQDKLQKALVSNPGAKETLLDFGKTDEQLDAGQWSCLTPAENVAAGLDLNAISLTTQEYPSVGREFINGECRLVVTCAIITNRGQGVADPNQVDAVQSYPTLAETWGRDISFYDNSNVGLSSPSLGVAQEFNLNPAQLFSDGVTFIQQFSGATAFTAETIDTKCCEGWSEGPIKGK